MVQTLLRGVSTRRRQEVTRQNQLPSSTLCVGSPAQPPVRLPQRASGVSGQHGKESQARHTGLGKGPVSSTWLQDPLPTADRAALTQPSCLPSPEVDFLRMRGSWDQRRRKPVPGVTTCLSLAPIRAETASTAFLRAGHKRGHETSSVLGRVELPFQQGAQSPNCPYMSSWTRNRELY